MAMHLRVLAALVVVTSSVADEILLSGYSTNWLGARLRAQRVASAPAAVPAPGPGPSLYERGKAAAAAGTPGLKGMPLKAHEQGYFGPKVQHQNQTTMTEDWLEEFSPALPPVQQRAVQKKPEPELQPELQPAVDVKEKSLLDNIKDFFKNMGDAIKEFFKNMGDAIKDFFENPAEALTQGMKNMRDAIGNAFEDLFGHNPFSAAPRGAGARGALLAAAFGLASAMC